MQSLLGSAEALQSLLTGPEYFFIAFSLACLGLSKAQDVNMKRAERLLTSGAFIFYAFLALIGTTAREVSELASFVLASGLLAAVFYTLTLVFRIRMLKGVVG